MNASINYLIKLGVPDRQPGDLNTKTIGKIAQQEMIKIHVVELVWTYVEYWLVTKQTRESS